jgi:hypothetical protein
MFSRPARMQWVHEGIAERGVHGGGLLGRRTGPVPGELAKICSERYGVEGVAAENLGTPNRPVRVLARQGYAISAERHLSRAEDLSRPT